MTNSPDILNAALALPESDRLYIAEQLLASVKPPPGILSADDPEGIAEILRRSEQIEHGELELLDHAEVMKRLRKSLESRSEA